MRLGSLLLTCAFATCAFSQGTTTTGTFTHDYNFPPVGLASSETAQVNILNVAPTSASATSTAPACSGTVTFVNASGKTIGTPASFTTTGSAIFSTQLTFSQLGATGTRGEFVASIQLTNSIPAKAPCSLVFSLETFDDSTGATHVYLGSSGIGAVVPTPILPVGFH
ncbi:MAG: hypothetical protein WBE37_25255 [Bryobacteraceae bacterium]